MLIQDVTPPHRTNAPPRQPAADNAETLAEELSVDIAWDEIEQSSNATVRPPAAGDGSGETAPDEENEVVLDIATTSRAANTAASLGRAPVPQPTAKINPFDLAAALARASKKDEADR